MHAGERVLCPRMSPLFVCERAQEGQVRRLWFGGWNRWEEDDLAGMEQVRNLRLTSAGN